MTTDSLNQWILVPAIAGAVALVLALVLFLRVRSLPEGNDTMKRIAGYIREGAMAFLSAEYKVLAIYAVVVFGAMAASSLGWQSGVWFLLGAILSLVAGFIGMKAATLANVRTAQAASSGKKGDALVTALDGGAVMGLCVAGLSLIGLFVVYKVTQTTTAMGEMGASLHAFAVGAS